MSRAGFHIGASSSDVAMGAALIAVIALGVGLIGWVLPRASKHDTTPLGTWTNMPPSTSCDISSNNVSAPICELLGNISYRGLVLPLTNSVLSGLNARLIVYCIVDSNNAGAAQLQLQYAISDGVSNITNFQNIDSPVFIDGLNGCPPDKFASSSTQVLNSTGNNQGYIFRVVGSDGGGLGDNPRFASVNVELLQTVTRVFTPAITSHSTTTFTTVIATSPTVTIATAVTFMWIASNSTATNSVDTQNGSNSCTIALGASSCSVTTTFVTAFKNTPNVVATPTHAIAGVTVVAGMDSLLLAQTLTV